MCNRTEVDFGSVISPSSAWSFTGSLVQRVSVPVETTICSKHNNIINAFLPISELTKEDATNLCNKFGAGVGIAGNFVHKGRSSIM